MSLKTFAIAVIRGDGIGHEVVPEGIRVPEAAGARFGFKFDWHSFDWSCETYLASGAMMPSDGLNQLRRLDAIYLRAVGRPDVPDHVSLWGLLIPIRRTFRQYVNLRPVRLLDGIETPLKDRKPADIDFTIVRENNEAEYSNIGGRIYEGTSEETVVQQTVFTRTGVDRLLRLAFNPARSRRKHLTSATESNGIIHTMPFWDGRFRILGADYPDVGTDQYHIDILTAHFVCHPDWFDVVVGSNLFGAFCPTSDQRSLGPSAWLLWQISIPKRSTHPCSSRFTVPLRHLGQGHRQSHRSDLVGCAHVETPRRVCGG